MRSNKMSPAGDTGANRSKNDISADELLALLHKSVEKDKDKPRADDRERLSVKSVEPLRIDDSTFDAAKNELYRSEDELIYEDLDIDELLRKYAGKPSGKRSDSAVSENAPAPVLLWRKTRRGTAGKRFRLVDVVTHLC